MNISFYLKLTIFIAITILIGIVVSAASFFMLYGIKNATTLYPILKHILGLILANGLFFFFAHKFADWLFKTHANETHKANAWHIKSIA